MLSTCTVEFDLVDPSSPGKGATRLSLVEVEHDNGRNNGIQYSQEKRVPEGQLKRDQQEEEVPRPGCCGCCELGTAKLLGGKVVTWMTGTVLPIAFGFMKEYFSNCFK
jgi:hypothetical protein